MNMVHTHPIEQPRRTGMEWFYRLLDVEYGIEQSVQEATRLRSWQAALFSFVINSMLLLFFALLWIRYDLWSTSTVFLPVTNNVMQVVPSTGYWESVRWALGLIMGLVTAFFTSLIQWAYARSAASHDAKLWALASACLFDIATDYVDVSKDFPQYFASMINATNGVSSGWWLLGGFLLIAASFWWSGSRSLCWIGALACFACLFTAPSNIFVWVVIFIATIFCSFAAQSLVLIHGAKCLVLLTVARDLRARAFS